MQGWKNLWLALAIISCVSCTDDEEFPQLLEPFGQPVVALPAGSPLGVGVGGVGCCYHRFPPFSSLGAGRTHLTLNLQLLPRGSGSSW